jgi:hypothetical protein
MRRSCSLHVDAQVAGLSGNLERIGVAAISY